MTETQIQHRLKLAGASETEARDLAPVMFINGWSGIRATKPSEKVISDAGTWLQDWRKERQGLAAWVRTERQKRVDAGYHSKIKVSDPVYLNGETAW